MKPFKQEEQFLIPALLDPRFKTKAIPTSQLGGAISKLLLQIKNEIARSSIVPQQTSAGSSGTSGGSFRYMNSAGPSVSRSTKSETDIFNAYLSTPLWPENSCVVAFWKFYPDPTLKAIAFKFWTIRPTSIDSERLFSEVDDILTDDRNRLLPQQTGNIVFIKHNICLR